MDNKTDNRPELITKSEVEKIIACTVVTARSAGVNSAVCEMATMFEDWNPTTELAPSPELSLLKTALTNIQERAQADMERAVRRYIIPDGNSRNNNAGDKEP